MKEDELPDLIRFPSLGTILEELPPWLDDLLADPYVAPKGTLRRSASDSAAILDVPSDLQCLISKDSEENFVPGIAVPKSMEVGEGSDICNGLEGSCLYGPNSPRRKSSLTNLEVSVLLGSIPPNKLQYVTVDFPSSDTIRRSNPRGDLQISTGDLDPEKAARR